MDEPPARSSHVGPPSMPDGGPHLFWNGAVDARSEHRNFCASRRLSEETNWMFGSDGRDCAEN